MGTKFLRMKETEIGRNWMKKLSYQTKLIY
jgi:hypothetical protein